MIKRKSRILARPSQSGRAENGPGASLSPLRSRADLLRQRKLTKLWKDQIGLTLRYANELRGHRSTAATHRELVKVTAKIMDLEMRQEKVAA